MTSCCWRQETHTVTLDMQAFFFPPSWFCRLKAPAQRKRLLASRDSFWTQHCTNHWVTWSHRQMSSCNGHGRYDVIGCHIWQCNQHSYHVLFCIPNLNWILRRVPSVPQILTNVNFVIGAVAANLKWLKKATTFVHLQNKRNTTQCIFV